MKAEEQLLQEKYPYGLNLIKGLVGTVFPIVDTELERYLEVSRNAPDSILGSQAAASIRDKRFHAQGGSVYALYPGTDLSNAVKFIVAFQTISDYLDNLCDRVDILDETALMQLHISMSDAVDPNSPLADYYLLYPYKDDGGYLKGLVEECRYQVSKLPSYEKISRPLKKYVGLYSELQAFKHIQLEYREKKLRKWAFDRGREYSGISGWEFCAATGSTLGMFLLFCLASSPDLGKDEIIKAENAYFPWICGLHILLDYFIDAQEDYEMGDLNFIHYYDSMRQCEDRLLFFLEESLKSCKSLSYPKFHTTVIKGLLAMYLSDPKACTARNKIVSRRLIKAAGLKTEVYNGLCRGLRVLGKI